MELKSVNREWTCDYCNRYDKTCQLMYGVDGIPPFLCATCYPLYWSHVGMLEGISALANFMVFVEMEAWATEWYTKWDLGTWNSKTDARWEQVICSIRHGKLTLDFPRKSLISFRT